MRQGPLLHGCSPFIAGTMTSTPSLELMWRKDLEQWYTDVVVMDVPLTGEQETSLPSSLSLLIMSRLSTWSWSIKPMNFSCAKVLVSRDNFDAWYRRLCWMVEENTSRTRGILKRAVLMLFLLLCALLKKIKGWVAERPFIEWLSDVSDSSWCFAKLRAECLYGNCGALNQLPRLRPRRRLGSC